MRLFAATLGLLTAAPSFAAAAQCDLPLGRRASVARVLDGETLQLADGAKVRLLGIVAPRRPPWWRKPEPWPAAEAARKALAALAEGRSVSLHFDGLKVDRRGRALAQVFSGDGADRLWLQGRLVAAGRVRVYAFADNQACASALLGLEQAARAKKKGLWRLSPYDVLAADGPDAVDKRRQTLQIVEGRVASVGRTQRWWFLNFGKDWKEDFTAAIAAPDVQAFARAGIDLDGLKGARVRLRGWIERWNGPAIKLTHPGQLEILQPAPVPAKETATLGGE